MGVVYRARHEQLGRVRALKLLPARLAHDQEFRTRFEREWRLAASIEHPNIVEVLDAGEAGDDLYILMRLVEGHDLAKLVASEGALAPERTLHIVEQIGDALDAAHSQGLVHRDVTPRNILIAEDGHAYLADFGIARTTSTEGLTRTGYFVGSLDYAAPEQIEAKKIDGRTDIYTLGGVLFTCLTGRVPYECDTDVKLISAHLKQPPPVPSTVRPGLSPALDGIVAKAMAKAPDDRYQSCADLVAALRDALGSPSFARSGNGAPGRVDVHPRDRLETGDYMGEYRIERRLGHGGMGIVYLAVRPRLGGNVALKILGEELSGDARFRDRFVRESQMVSALDHPNIIPVYDAGEVDGIFFISMRYVDGPSLKTLLEQEAPLAPMRALSLLGQVGGALDAAHAHGLVHRDVKPANILVARGGASEFGEHAYLTDFGVSKRVESHSGLTGTGQFIGTLSYAAPEQIQGQPVDSRADVYALGCVLYECLLGMKPFERENDMAVLWAHVTEPPPRPSEHAPGLPPAFDEVIQRALAKAPEERYATCRDLLAAAGSALAPVPADPTVAAATVAETAVLPTVVAPQAQTAVQPVVPPPPPPAAPVVAAASADARGARPAGEKRDLRRLALLLLLVALVVAGIGAALGLTVFHSSTSSSPTTSTV